MKILVLSVLLFVVGSYGCGPLEGNTKTNFVCRPLQEVERPDYMIPKGTKLTVNFLDRDKRLVDNLQFRQERRLVTLSEGDYRCRPEWWWKQGGPDTNEIMLFLDTPQATKIREQREKLG